MNKILHQPGLFIVFEGQDGVGKTTHSKLLREYLNAVDIDVVLTREPGGSPIAEEIRSLLEKVDDHETTMYLMQAARIENLKNTILPALERGAVVICDRFIHSTIIYQGYAGEQDLDIINVLNRSVSDRAHPDYIFHLYSDKRRIAFKKSSDLSRFEQSDFQKNVITGYDQEFLSFERDDVFNINTDGTVEETQREVREMANLVMVNYLTG